MMNLVRKSLLCLTGLAIGVTSLLACDETTPPVVPTNSGDCPIDGGVMARLPEGFCIDRTEVTRGAYFAWLETNPSTTGQSDSCAANDDFTPTCLTEGGWGLDRKLDNPVSCVDWCDAKAFCENHGKRLCGGLGGGQSPPDSFDDPAVSEWHAACSSGGNYDYVYGDAYTPKVCRETLRESWGSAVAGDLAQCVSPLADYAGVYDLSGHLAEWEDSCELGDVGELAGGRCRVRGGSFKHEGNGTRCDAGRTLRVSRLGTDDAIGFRCCAD